jgi:predicted transcriptional regulator YdeE
MSVVTHRAFTVVGISARTNNAREFSGSGVIAEMWDRVAKEGLLDQIPERVDRSIVAVYTNYESDHTGEYDFVLGAKVAAGSSVPPGMTALEIPAQLYQIVSTEPGPPWQNVPAAWKQVWDSMSEKRAFLADFELYDERAQDPEKAIIDVWVGLKS